MASPHDNIDELHFEVILHDEKFNERIAADLKAAQDFNTSLSAVLDLKSKVASVAKVAVSSQSQVTRETQKIVEVSKEWEAAQKRRAENLEQERAETERIASETDVIIDKLREQGSATKDNVESTKRVAENTDEAKKAQVEHAKAILSSRENLSGMESALRTIAQLTGVTFGIAGARRFVESLVDITGQFEVQKMALTSMLQDAGKAEEIFDTLRQNALNSPYTFQDLTKFAKQLTAFDIGTDSLVETERRLADVAAGLGVDMGRIILAYGQVKAAGVLKGTELRQFTEAGVPLLQTLAQQIQETEGRAISLSEVFQRISKKEIPFEMVEESFRRMTDEGGKFYNMQEVLVNTLQGKIGKLRDVWQQTLYDIGNSNSKVLKGGVDLMTNFAAHIEDIGRVLAPVVAGFGAYYAALLLIKGIGMAGVLASEAKAFLTLAQAEGFATTATIAFGSALKGIAAATGIIALLGVAVYEVYQHFKEVREEQERATVAMKKYDAELSNETQRLDEVREKLRSSTKGTKEWTDAKNEAVRQYGKYFPGLDAEITKVGNLETAYNDLTTAVIESTKARQVADFQQSEKQIWDDANKSNVDNLRDLLYKKYSRADAYIIASELEKAIRDGKQWGDIKDDKRLIEAISRTETRNTEARVRNLFSETLKENEKNRQQYLANVRAIVKEYGLQGTELDPDFTGPIPSKKNDKPGTAEDQNKWIPIKETKEAVDNWAAMADDIAAIDKENERILEESTKEIEKTLDDRQKAMSAFDAFLEKTFGRTQRTGTGAMYKLTGLIGDKEGADSKAAEEYKKHLGELRVAFDETSDAFKNGKKKLDEWLSSVKEGNKAKFTENIRGLANEIFKDGMQGYDLSDWSHKSLSEILDIKNAVENVRISDDIKDLVLEKVGQEALDALNDALDKLKENFNNNTVDPKVTQKWAKYAKQLAGYLSKAGDAMKRLGDATDNSGLSDAGEVISAIGQNLSAAAEGFQKGGWIGAVVGGVFDIFNQITGAVSEANEEMKKMDATIRDIRIYAESSAFKRSLAEGTDGIFGENFVASVRNAAAGLDEARKKVDSLTVSFEKYRQEQMKLAGMGGVGSLYYGLDAFGLGSTNPEDALIKTKHSFWKGDTYNSIAGIAEEFGMALKDVNGNLNPELLDRIVSTYGELNDGLMEWLLGAKEYSEEYAQAMEQIEDATKDIFGNLASDMADQFIDNFLAMGNAVDDLSGTFANLGDAILRSFLQSYVLDEILAKYEAAATAALKKYSTGQMTPDEYAAWLNGFAQNVQQEAETLAPAINGMIEAFKDRGLMNIDESTANSVGAGIKGITEDTANLLASYINAIRADVSYMRVMQEKGWSDVAAIAGAVASPTLNDYVAQIAASNYDIAQSNQRILSELQSVIGAPGTSGMVVRVESN